MIYFGGCRLHLFLLRLSYYLPLNPVTDIAVRVAEWRTEEQRGDQAYIEVVISHCY